MKTLFVLENEMPASCYECPLKDGGSDFPNFYCNVTGEIVNDYEDTDKTRHSTCPLQILQSD